MLDIICTRKHFARSAKWYFKFWNLRIAAIVGNCPLLNCDSLSDQEVIHPVVKKYVKNVIQHIGDAGYRSPYLSHAKRALYHLSYIPWSLIDYSIIAPFYWKWYKLNSIGWNDDTRCTICYCKSQRGAPPLMPKQMLSCFSKD